ncbi:unnamed protein product, partial [Prorocentrum cordatum]
GGREEGREGGRTERAASGAERLGGVGGRELPALPPVVRARGQPPPGPRGPRRLSDCIGVTSWTAVVNLSIIS